jgi:hypothetical protein
MPYNFDLVVFARYYGVLVYREMVFALVFYHMVVYPKGKALA